MSAAALPAPLVAPYRHPLRWIVNKVHTLAWGVIFTYVGVLVIVALYYLLFEVNPTMTRLWHNAVSNNDLRHNIRNVGEGFLGGLLGQMIVWNHYKKLKKRGKLKLLDKIEIKLRVPNVKDGKMLSGWQTAASIPLALIYAVPGFLVCLWLSHKLKGTISDINQSATWLHFHSTHAASLWQKTRSTFADNWDKKLMGYGAAFFFGRRPAKGVFDDVQLWFAQRRILLGKGVRWYHPPTFKARYNDAKETGVVGTAAHGRTQTYVTVGLSVLGVGLAGFGWYVLNYIA